MKEYDFRDSKEFRFQTSATCIIDEECEDDDPTISNNYISEASTCLHEPYYSWVW